jgi:hypothetical protein
MDKNQARVAHRRRHKKNQHLTLTERIRRNDREANAIERQFIELAEIHKLEPIDPIESAPIPYVVYAQDAEASRFRRAEVCAAALGALVAAGLSVRTIVGGELQVFLTGLIVALLVAGVLIGVMLGAVRANPHNPNARRALTAWLVFFGALVGVSLTGFLYWRFIENLAVLQQIGLAIVGFEVGMLGLAAVFHALRSLYAWSRDLTETYNRLMEERTALERDEVFASDELTRLAGITGKDAEADFVGVHGKE